MLETVDKTSDESSGGIPDLKLKCYPSQSFSINARSSHTVYLIVSEDKENPMNKLLEQEGGLHCLIHDLSLVNKMSKIEKYTSSSGNSYPSIRVNLENPLNTKVNFSRSRALVVITLKQSPLTVNITNNLCSVDLPNPVPAMDSLTTTTSILDNIGLPEPVPSVVEKPAPVPSEDEMKKWPVKKLKSCLADEGLHQYGLKMDLVKRLFQYYTENPSKVPKPPVSSKDVATEVIDLLLQNTLLISDAKARKTNPERRIVVDDCQGKNVSLTNTAGVYTLNGKQIPVLGSTKTQSVKKVTTAAREVVDKNSEQEKIMRKMGEIKSFEKLKLTFFNSGQSIVNCQDIRVEPGEKEIITFRLSELDLFSSELAGRRVLVKERDNDRDILTIHKQIANIMINERRVEVKVLVENTQEKEVIVMASERVKLIRVYVERAAKDLDHQFDIPEDDDVINDVNDMLAEEAYDAATTNDIVLMPKTYHTELCKVKLDSPLDYNPFVLMERTKASSMQIGMRKMIIIPKVLSFLNTEQDSSEATLLIKMYNASKQTLRVTKKTKIATVRLQKRELWSERELIIDPDQRRRYGEVRNLEPGDLREEKPVLLSFTVDGVEKPSVVRVVKKNNKLCIPLGYEPAAGK